MGKGEKEREREGFSANETIPKEEPRFAAS